MSKKNMKTEEKVDTPIGVHDLTTDQKLENLARNVFSLMEQVKGMSTALDNVYIQVATLIEVLADDPKILNPEIWEKKLKEVTEGIKETMEAMDNEKRNKGKGVINDPDGPNEGQGSGKIIMPDNRIIIPGQ